jgi:hypothetical protein
MRLRQRIITEIYDENDTKIVNHEIINDKEIKKLKDKFFHNSKKNYL